jgi:hypothetical protein
MKAYGEWRYSFTHSSILALDGGEWSASRPGRFTPRERAPGTHCIGGWVGPRAVLDAVVKRKIPSPRRKSNPDRPARSPALYQLSYHGSYFYNVDVWVEQNCKCEFNGMSCTIWLWRGRGLFITPCSSLRRLLFFSCSRKFFQKPAVRTSPQAVQFRPHSHSGQSSAR